MKKSRSDQKTIQPKIELLNLAQERGNVSRTSKTMGVSRDTFYRDTTAVQEDGIDALIDQNRRKPKRDQHKLMGFVKDSTKRFSTNFTK